MKKMKNFLLSIFSIIFFTLGAQTGGQNCDDLFISEYVEGSGNNKALEIYNPTSGTIDLSEYIVIRYSNGSNSANPNNAIQLVGSILSNDVHVGVIEKLNPVGTGNEVPVDSALQLKADAFYCPDYNTSNAWYWNGNDAIVLAKGSVNDIANSVIIDVFGKVGEDPGPDGGWTNVASNNFQSSGYSWTEDHTLIRKSSVRAGDTNPVDPFDVSLEWDSIAEDNWDYLGSHTCDCSGTTLLEELNTTSFILYPNPVNIGQSVSVKSNQIIKNIIVTNILGEQFRFENSINTSRLATGVYIVDIYFVNGYFAKNKLIVD